MPHEGPGGRWLPWPVSLRARLLAAALCVLAAGAAGMTGACALAARGYLMGQADGQLRAYADQLTGHPFAATPWSGPAPGAGGAAGPGGAVSIEVRGAGGQRVLSQGWGNRAGQASPAVTAGVTAHAGRLATIAAGGGSWRVIAVPIHYQSRRLPFTYTAEDFSLLITRRARPGLDGTLVAGLDLASVGQATGRLVVTGLAVSGVVILALACLGAVVIRAILRPIGQVQQTVAAAAAGELAARVPERHASGLACSVNTMLRQIEHAFRTHADAEAAARRSARQMRQIIASTAHQIRRPLSIVHGAAAWYRHRGQPGTGELDRMIRQVTGQAARIDALLDEVLPTGHDQPLAPDR
jgi:signal transduction histidine kinase